MKYLVVLLLLISNLIGANMKESIYDFNVKTIDGKTISMSEYKHKVLLIVNVASKCGFTSQYEGLEKLYEKYKDKGFVILGFPCNQFMNQEPGTNEEIKEFCSLTYQVKFPMFSKIDVNGDDTEPLYKYLKEQVSGVLGTELIKWNFTKFLVDKNGKVIERFSPSTTPESIEKDIEKLL
ncbi:glutathione peroxidase [Arcobacter sp. CECT 8985]|nr:glutathione peroxidase [Arcobacter sp. CECT 8985]